MNVILTKKNGARGVAPQSANESGTPGATPDASPPPPDGAFDRLLKLIPADVVAGYTALLAIAAPVTDSTNKFPIPTALLACSALLVLVLRRAGLQMSPPRQPPLLQYIFSMLAFWTWAIAIHDPLQAFGCAVPKWIPAFGCVLLPLLGSYLVDLTENRGTGQ